MNRNNKPAAGALPRTVNVVGTTAAWYEWDATIKAVLHSSLLDDRRAGRD